MHKRCLFCSHRWLVTVVYGKSSRNPDTRIRGFLELSLWITTWRGVFPFRPNNPTWRRSMIATFSSVMIAPRFMNELPRNCDISHNSLLFHAFVCLVRKTCAHSSVLYSYEFLSWVHIRKPCWVKSVRSYQVMVISFQIPKQVKWRIYLT